MKYFVFVIVLLSWFYVACAQGYLPKRVFPTDCYQDAERKVKCNEHE